MNRIILFASALTLSLTLLLSVSAGSSPIHGQQQNQTTNTSINQTAGAMGNQTNQTGGGEGGMQQQEQQQNETGIGTAQEIESLTPPRGGVGQQQEGGELGIVGGLEKQTAGNETVGGLQATGNATGEALQTVGNETRQFIGNISEGVQGFFN
jgi:hypothetical protein